MADLETPPEQPAVENETPDPGAPAAEANAESETIEEGVKFVTETIQRRSLRAR